MRSKEPRRESYIAVQPDALRRAMALRALSAADLAAKAEVTAGTMSRIVRGKAVSPATLRRVLKALDKTPVLSIASEVLAS